MHVVLDARMLDSGGIGTYLKNLILKLKAYPLRLELLVTEQSLKKHSFLIEYDCRVFNTPIYSIKEQYLFPKIIPHCDLFWSPHFNVPLLPIKAQKRLVSIHDVFHLAWSKSFSLLERLYAKKLIQTAAKRSDRVITVSQFSATQIINYTSINPKKMEVIYHGIDHYNFSDSDQHHRLQQDALPKRYVLFVGNLKPHKNLLNLLKAFSQVVEHDPDLYLIIVGKKTGFIHGENFDDIMKQNSILDQRVQFLDYVEDQSIRRLYTGAECLIFPSFYEGFGFPPLEAMSVGCPVVASSIPSLQEICKEVVFYIDPYSVESISQGILSLLQNAPLKRLLIQRGKEHVKRFTWSMSAEDHYSIIKELIESDKN